MTMTDVGYGPYARTPAAIDARERAEAVALRERHETRRRNTDPRAPSYRELLDQQAAEVEGARAKYAAERAALKREQARAATVAATAAAQRDEALAPIKTERRRAFLLTHPDASDAAFERYWGRIADDEAAAARERAIEQEAARLRATGRHFSS